MRFTSAKFFAIIFSIIIVSSVVVLPTFVHAVGETALEQQAFAKSNALDLVECGGIFSDLKVSCIVPQLTYYLLYIPAMGLLALSGYIFDFVLSLSIDHTFINQSFVSELWKIIRDFSNMIFIFILLYTGVQTIFGMGKWQQTIIKVVIVALLVNFSMFFTKVVIDAGNILAVGVYEGMGATKVDGIDRPHKSTAMGDVKERTISATLVNALNPQQFATLSANNRGAAVTIFIVAAVVCAYAAFIFIRASLLFVGRLIAFWFLMAISPFALISMTLPKGNIWGWWTNTLINQAFVAPVFLILIYFILKAITGLKTVLGNGGNVSETYFDAIVIPIVMTVMVVYALQRALGVAKDMSGKFGGIGADALGKIMSSFPMGMALGGGAALLRTSVGSRAGKLSDSGKFKQMSSNPNSALARFTGRTLQSLTDKAHNSSFDVRNADTVKWATKNAKSAFDVKIDLGKAEGKGGYKAALEKAEKDAKAEAEKMKVTSTEKENEAARMDSRYREAKEQEEAHTKAQFRTESAHKEAEKNLQNTKEWKEHENIKNNTETARSSFKSAEGSLVKKIDDLKKRQAETKIPELQSSLQEEITNTEEEIKKAKEDLDKEEQKLIDAKNAYEKTVENIKLNEAKDERDWAVKKYKETKEIIEETEKAVEVWEDQENRQRRGFSAENSMNSVFSSTKYYLSKEDRASVIKKVRKGDDKEKKKQEKFMKDLRKSMEEKEAKESKEEKPEEGKKE
ncbi:MAG: hypothetical protein A3B07_02930 [Candidatus Yonathbacteria bacterium RIFCSPLOWO2_01_FULL_43_27]|uniref:Uncharacterized protein n=1 Tax=Candidatus Yonathbacteria bacterium RIFCSPLOWO2_01_FULL_43_27 TaxID=1802726 RepID=A0A1G2SBZ5_9BACT|nr:MAG: hypothetical protein A3B07_02930 [Candidatus Yonathbacteria bacterium RIFCSPLOWO2_01_FULL_43_27]